MSRLPFASRIALLLAIFVGVGFLAWHLVIHHAVARGTPEYDVRPAGLMAGLFAGGTATLLAGIGLVLASKRKSAQ